MMQKIAEHNIQKWGARGLTLALPKVFAADNELEPGLAVEIYRDKVDGKDALILIPKNGHQTKPQLKLQGR